MTRAIAIGTTTTGAEVARVPSDARLFQLLDAHAPWRATHLTPALSAWHADDELSLWQALELEAGAALAPPFFCVAWPGAQALAKALADGLVDVAGRRVADVGAGSGLASTAAMVAGAAVVHACEIDALAARAAQELGRRHGVVVHPQVGDALGLPESALHADVILAGDLVYGERQRELFARALALWRAAGKLVIVADSGRPFFDARGLTTLFAVDVTTPRALDGVGRRTVTVYRA